MNDLIDRQAAICIASGYCHPANIAKELAKLPSVQPLTEDDYIELHDRFGTWVEEVVRDMISGEGKRWGERMNDLIYRQDAIDALDCINGVEEVLRALPSAQPTQTNTPNTLKSLDCIDRQAAIDAIETKIKKWNAVDGEGCHVGLGLRYTDVVDMLTELPSAQPEWIPCSERLPEEDVEVLITYRYKEGEGDTSHADIDITTYGQMYFGGNKVGNHKHWRQPFEYFESNYEVVAWMPLPEPYKGEEG